jgi:hypothetical protein
VRVKVKRAHRQPAARVWRSVKVENVMTALWTLASRPQKSMAKRDRIVFCVWKCWHQGACAFFATSSSNRTAPHRTIAALTLALKTEAACWFETVVGTIGPNPHRCRNPRTKMSTTKNGRPDIGYQKGQPISAARTIAVLLTYGTQPWNRAV